MGTRPRAPAQAPASEAGDAVARVRNSNSAKARNGKAAADNVGIASGGGRAYRREREGHVDREGVFAPGQHKQAAENERAERNRELPRRPPGADRLADALRQARSIRAAGRRRATAECEVEPAHARTRPRRTSWARLLKRVCDIDMQQCPNCGSGQLRIIAAIVDRSVVEKILSLKLICSAL